MTSNELLFAVFPYVAFALLLVVTVLRWRLHPFTVSSLSSQLLESRRLYWGSVSFHWGLSLILLGHLAALLVPRGFELWNGAPLRLYLLEATGLALGLWAAFGLGVLASRRFGNARIRAVSTPMDHVVLAIIGIQIVTGIWTAVGYRWGSFWAPPSSCRTSGRSSSSTRSPNTSIRSRSCCSCTHSCSGCSSPSSPSPASCTSSRCRWVISPGHGSELSGCGRPRGPTIRRRTETSNELAEQEVSEGRTGTLHVVHMDMPDRVDRQLLPAHCGVGGRVRHPERY